MARAESRSHAHKSLTTVQNEINDRGQGRHLTTLTSHFDNVYPEQYKDTMRTHAYNDDHESFEQWVRHLAQSAGVPLTGISIGLVSAWFIKALTQKP